MEKKLIILALFLASIFILSGCATETGEQVIEGTSAQKDISSKTIEYSKTSGGSFGDDLATKVFVDPTKPDCYYADNYPISVFISTNGLTNSGKTAVIGIQCNSGQYVETYECQKYDDSADCIVDKKYLFWDFWKKESSTNNLRLKDYAYTNSRVVRYTYLCIDCEEVTPQCSDECSLGTTVCSSSSSLRVCGDWDSDDCYEWKTVSCPNDQICQNNDCVDKEPEPKPDSCVGVICNDNDPCTIDSCIEGLCLNQPKNCPSGSYCSSGTCTEFDTGCKRDTDCDDANPETEDLCVETKCTNTEIEPEEKEFLKSYGIIIVIVLIGLGTLIYMLIPKKKKGG